jgi:hypothetical protein
MDIITVKICSFEIFGSNCRVFVRRRVGEQMISACLVLTMKEEVWWCFAGDTICDFFRIQGTLNQHGYHSILQQYTIPSGLHVGLSFVIQQDNRLCKGYLTKEW